MCKITREKNLLKTTQPGQPGQQPKPTSTVPGKPKKPHTTQNFRDNLSQVKIDQRTNGGCIPIGLSILSQKFTILNRTSRVQNIWNLKLNVSAASRFQDSSAS